MPLLDIVGVDACQKSFCIAFAFLSGEEESDYIWALERLRSIYDLYGARLPAVILTDRCLACMNAVSSCFPSAVSLLCLWHANKAVFNYCRPAFGKDTVPGELEKWNMFIRRWYELMASSTTETFEQRLQALKEQYALSYTREISYLMDIWLDPYKEKLVKAWVDQYTHFDNVVTSRTEGIHQLIKIHLKTGTLDLFDAWRSIKRVVINQIKTLRDNQAKQRLRIPIEFSGRLYDIVHGWVSYEALRKVDEQRKLLRQGDNLPICTGRFTASLGLPCAHIIKPLIQ